MLADSPSSAAAPTFPVDRDCPAVSYATTEDPTSAITFQQRSENLIDVADDSLCLAVSSQGNVLYRQRFLLEHEWHVDNALITLDLPLAEYRIEVKVFPEGDECSTDLTVRDSVSRDLSYFPWHACLFQVEETQWWIDVDSGAEVPQSSLEEYFGSTHCGWQSMRFIYLDVDQIQGHFVRDPDEQLLKNNLLSTSFRGDLGLDHYGSADLEPEDIPHDAVLSFALEADVPADAVSLGLIRGNRQLLVAPSDDMNYIYVATPHGVERWPRIRPMILCE